MALHPFLAYMLPVVVLVIGEIAFVFLFCRKQRPRLKRDVVVGWCWLIAIAFGIANIFITANRTEVWVIESDNDYSHKCVLKRTGEYDRIGRGDYYIVNNSNQPVYYAELHYGFRYPVRFNTTSSQDVIKPIYPGTTVAIDKDLNGVFVTPPNSIRVKRGTSSIRCYLLNERQVQDL